MASLDDIYDAKDKLENSNLEYLLIVVQKGKDSGKADVFFNLKNAKSLLVLNKGLKIFQEEITKIDEND